MCIGIVCIISSMRREFCTLVLFTFTGRKNVQIYEWVTYIINFIKCRKRIKMIMLFTVEKGPSICFVAVKGLIKVNPNFYLEGKG